MRKSEQMLRERIYGPNASTEENSEHDNSRASFMEKFIDTELMILIGFLGILLSEQFISLCLPSTKHGPLQSTVGTLHHQHISAHSNGTKKRRTKKTAHFSSTAEDLQSEPLVVLRGVDGNSSVYSSTSESSSDELDFRSVPSQASSTVTVNNAGNGGHSHCHLPSNGSVTQIGFLLLAMSTHSIFEGIALGAMENPSLFLRLLLIIMLHEVLCSFAYGVSLSNQMTSTRLAVFSSTFLACSIPLGMTIMSLIGTLRDGTIALTIRFCLEGFSSGIFIYVACVEMLAGEFQHRSTEKHFSGFFKAVTVIGGAFLAFIINILINH